MTARPLCAPSDVEVIDSLAQGERNVEVIAGETGSSVANTSRHLRSLKTVHLLATRKEGPQIFYRLADPTVCAATSPCKRSPSPGWRGGTPLIQLAPHHTA